MGGVGLGVCVWCSPVDAAEGGMLKWGMERVVSMIMGECWVCASRVLEGVGDLV
jgi:hypothetical protein